MAMNFSYPFQIHKKTKRVVEADEHKRIHDSVMCILLTHVKERWMTPDFGSRMQDYVFETQDAGTIEMLRREILASLDRWSFQITNYEVMFTFEEHQLRIEVQYQYHNQEQQTALLYLEMK